MRILLLFLISIVVVNFSQCQEIPPIDLPEEVRVVLHQYISLLKNAKDTDEAATKLFPLAGGSLVNEDGKALRNAVKPIYLKRDFNSIFTYAYPIIIAKVDVSVSESGFGESTIQGKTYKIWIAKAEGKFGPPAPITILIPENHTAIKGPRIVGIGNL